MMVVSDIGFLHPDGATSHGTCEGALASGAAWPQPRHRAGGGGASARLLQALSSGGQRGCKTQFLPLSVQGALIPRWPPGRHFLCGPPVGHELLLDGAQAAPTAPSRPRVSRTAFHVAEPEHPNGNVESPEKKAHGEHGADDPDKDKDLQTVDKPTKEEEIAFEAARQAGEETENLDKGLGRIPAPTPGEKAALGRGMREAKEELAEQKEAEHVRHDSPK
mmetsp:Transcript_14369/g.19390  ORF Transcript_14369/g.19390 Transcript_14369/m.19390 type:complete len:220 (-) Transcript_14369:75-734(-)